MTSRREFRQARFAAPAGSCEILLIRHGESMPLAEGASFPMRDGHGDPPLADEGHEQAQQIADRFVASDEAIDAIYVTTLQRTHQTAAPLAAARGMETIVEPDLREVGLGEWDGGEFRVRVANEDPIAMKVYTEQRWDVIPGGEPLEQFRERVVRGIERIVATHPDQLVAAFVHGGVIGELLNAAAGTSGFTFTGAANGSISHLVVTDGSWIIRAFNDTSHLSPRFRTVAPAV